MKKKIPYNIRKSLIKLLPFAAVAIMASSCTEKHDVIIDYTWGPVPTPKEVIQNEINKKNVNMVFLNCGEKNVTHWTPSGFHRARDTLQTRLDIAPGRIRGMGTIYVNSRNGAHLPSVDIDTIEGMGFLDSVWYTANGWKVQRLHPLRTK